MGIVVRTDREGVDWQQVSDILRTVGMAYRDAEIHRQAFEASRAVVFLYDGDELIGFGRAISDGVLQAAIYDCAVSPAYQGQGLGTRIMQGLLDQLPGCSAILYANIGKEGFYEKLGFRPMKTAMARFIDAEIMAERGFTE